MHKSLDIESVTTAFQLLHNSPTYPPTDIAEGRNISVYPCTLLQQALLRCQGGVIKRPSIYAIYRDSADAIPLGSRRKLFQLYM